MSYPCAPPMPVLPGAPPALPQLLFELPEPVPIPPPPAPPILAPRFVSELPIAQTPVNLWLATLCRATYSPDRTFFDRTARVVFPPTYPVTFRANSGSVIPGFGTIRLPEGAVVVVSGTTNLGQWMEQIFKTMLSDWVDAPLAAWVKASLSDIYRVAANDIMTAVQALVPNDHAILFTGHSMGGAVATAMHAAYSDTDNTLAPSRCVTFNAPRAGDARLATKARTGPQVYRRWAIAQDFVPGLPPDLSFLNMVAPEILGAAISTWARYRHAGDAYALSRAGEVETGSDPYFPGIIGRAMLSAVANQPVDLGSAHQMKTYCDRFLSLPGNGSIGASVRNWQAPADLAQINADLTTAGL